MLSVLGARMANFLLGGLAGVVVARSLAPDGRGAYAVVVAVASTATALCHLSVEQAHLAMWKNAAQRRALIANAMVLGVIVGVISAAGAYLIVIALGPSRVPVYSHVGLLLALAAVPFGLLAVYAKSLLALLPRIDLLNRGMLLGAILQTAALVGLAFVDRLTVTAVVVIWTITTSVPLLVSLPALRPRARDLSKPVMRAEVKLGLRYHGGVALLFLLFRADLLLVNAFLSRREVGLYALAVSLAELGFLLSDSIAQAIVARQASENLTDVTAITSLAMRMTAVGAVGLAALLGAAAPVMIPVVYGSAFRGAVPAFLLLLPGIAAFAFGRPVSSLLTALDRPLLAVALSGGAFVLDVVLAVLLIPSYGIAGAALASTIAYAMLCAGYVWSAHACGDVPYTDLIPRYAEIRGVLRVRRDQQERPRTC